MLVVKKSKQKDSVGDWYRYALQEVSAETLMVFLARASIYLYRVIESS
jgi:hypothetical protein